MSEHEYRGAPNLDCEGSSEYFWMKHQQGKRYRELFPNGGKGTKRAAADLANYASNKATDFAHIERESEQKRIIYSIALIAFVLLLVLLCLTT